MIGAASASADIVLLLGPGNFANDENVLYNADNLIGTGPLVQGVTNQSNAVVDFYGAGEDLTTPPGGQARIEAVDGSFTALTIALNTPGATFTSLIFNLDVCDGAGDGELTLTVNPTGESPVVYSNLALDENGENFFRIKAKGGETIDSVSFISTVPLAQLCDIQQVRIGGVVGAVAVPVPAAAVSGGALLAAGAVIRRFRAWRA